jgi:hypothetical protein
MSTIWGKPLHVNCFEKFSFEGGPSWLRKRPPPAPLSPQLPSQPPVKGLAMRDRGVRIKASGTGVPPVLAQAKRP